MADATRPPCIIDGCDKPQHTTRGWCSAHYTRWKRTGDPLTPLSRKPNIGDCSVEGCDQPSRKRGWCASHYAQWRREGSVKPFRYKWAERRRCKTCGEQCEAYGLREFCSGACWALWKASGGRRPTTVECISCGCRIDLLQRTGKGQRKKANVKFCRRCKAEYGKYKLTAAQLAVRDGAICGICTRPVDMKLRRSDPGGRMCASVDHIIPRALGGTHDPANLQLAHLYCNMVKSDRVAMEVSA